MITALTLFAVGGLLVGSFMTTVLRRRYYLLNVSGPRSRCESCNAGLGVLELVPLVSFAIQRGKCRRCRARIAPDHFAVELLAALLFASTVFVEQHIGEALVFALLLLAAALIDIYTLRIPNTLNAGLAITGIFFCLHNGEPIAPRLLSATLCCLALTACATYYEHQRGRTGLGRGDIKMFGAVSIWLPAEMAPWTIFIASSIALAFAFSSGRSKLAALPFAPFIAAAAYLVWYVVALGLDKAAA